MNSLESMSNQITLVLSINRCQHGKGVEALAVEQFTRSASGIFVAMLFPSMDLRACWIF